MTLKTDGYSVAAGMHVISAGRLFQICRPTTVKTWSSTVDTYQLLAFDFVTKVSIRIIQYHI